MISKTDLTLKSPGSNQKDGKFLKKIIRAFDWPRTRFRNPLKKFSLSLILTPEKKFFWEKKKSRQSVHWRQHEVNVAIFRQEWKFQALTSQRCVCFLTRELSKLTPRKILQTMQTFVIKLQVNEKEKRKFFFFFCGKETSFYLQYF